MIHTALFYIPVNFAFSLPHYVTAIAICTTQVKKKQSKKEILKIEKNKNKNNGYLAPVFQKLDSAIQRIKHYPLDCAIDFPNTYPVDGDLSGG